MKNQESIDKAFEALKTFEWGTDRKVLAAIDDAVPATHGDAAARKELETRLAAVLGSGMSRAAKDFAARKLTVIGTAAAVPALAALLADNELSHMGRYALERIPAAEAAQALRDALPKVGGKLKVGVIGSLGVRRDTAAISALAAFIGDADAAVAAAAASALGDIGTVDAVAALNKAGASASAAAKPAVADAVLASAECLLAAGNKAAALAAYKSLLGGNPPKNVRLAVTRGMLVASGKKE